MTKYHNKFAKSDTCDTCEKCFNFRRTKIAVEINGVKYCSKRCSNLKMVTCYECGKSFNSKKKSTYSVKGKRYYCSYSCYSKIFETSYDSLYVFNCGDNEHQFKMPANLIDPRLKEPLLRMDERALRILLNTEIPGYADEMGYGTSHTQYKVVKDIWIHEDCWIGRIRNRTDWHCYPKRCKSREDVILEMVEEIEQRRLLEMFQEDFW